MRRRWAVTRAGEAPDRLAASTASPTRFQTCTLLRRLAGSVRGLRFPAISYRRNRNRTLLPTRHRARPTRYLSCLAQPDTLAGVFRIRSSLPVRHPASLPCPVQDPTLFERRKRRPAARLRSFTAAFPSLTSSLQVQWLRLRRPVLHTRLPTGVTSRPRMRLYRAKAPVCLIRALRSCRSKCRASA